LALGNPKEGRETRSFSQHSHCPIQRRTVNAYSRLMGAYLESELGRCCRAGESERKRGWVEDGGIGLKERRKGGDCECCTDRSRNNKTRAATDHVRVSHFFYCDAVHGCSVGGGGSCILDGQPAPIPIDPAQLGSPALSAATQRCARVKGAPRARPSWRRRYSSPPELGPEFLLWLALHFQLMWIERVVNRQHRHSAAAVVQNRGFCATIQLSLRLPSDHCR